MAEIGPGRSGNWLITDVVMRDTFEVSLVLLAPIPMTVSRTRSDDIDMVGFAA